MSSKRDARSSPSPSPAADRSSQKAIGFLLMKIIEELKREKRPLKLSDLEQRIGEKISTHTALLQQMTTNPKIKYDAGTRLYSYTSPYPHVKTQEDLLNLINQSDNGIAVSDDLTEVRPEVEQWINQFLRERKVRAIRKSNEQTKLKCKENPGQGRSGAGGGCPLYGNRCPNCMKLNGIRLFPRAEEVVESSKVDDDIKTLWKESKPASWDVVTRDLGVRLGPAVMPQREEAATGKRKRGGPENLLKGRKKIHNLHILDKLDPSSQLNGS
ncbi:unnamed protein product [Vitrella brassicaformis CCMP3155]|uniref:TFIIE beta domain-containing protein n=1 Tax=Vitrella brassicaformis (strain CCMP3155) TaxID=1169540 RepID=A0A0G4EJP1_VITBC|nr:unnamed protein product [Vitrella brassicaformis CCMP3155]|eukprot:CEL96606.1 unnamed protein product [Vitrella brassicaformis CCMP3155]